MVKPNIQNKSSATNARPPGPQATSTSVGKSPDSLNLIFRASSRAGKRIHPRERSCARRTVRCSSRSVSAAEDSRKVSLEPSSSSEESRGLASRVICAPQALLSTSLMSHGPNHGTAESSSLAEGGSAVTGTCDMTGDCNTLSHMMSHIIVTCGIVNTMSYLCLVTLVI